MERKGSTPSGDATAPRAPLSAPFPPLPLSAPFPPPPSAPHAPTGPGRPHEDYSPRHPTRGGPAQFRRGGPRSGPGRRRRRGRGECGPGGASRQRPLPSAPGPSPPSPPSARPRGSGAGPGLAPGRGEGAPRWVWGLGPRRGSLLGRVRGLGVPGVLLRGAGPWARGSPLGWLWGSRAAAGLCAVGVKELSAPLIPVPLPVFQMHVELRG